MGRSNVGKTVFVDCLNGKANDPFYEKPNTSKQSDNEAIRIGEWHNLFRTAPGQESLNRLKVIDKAFENTNSLEGVIYLVDWGYTNFRSDVFKRKMIEEDGITNIEELRKINLKNEIEDFKSVTEEIRKCFIRGNSIKWLLVISTKTDLYYSEEEFSEAEKYYHPFFDGEFSKLLNELSLNIGKDRLKIDAIPFCSYPEDFVWNDQKLKSKIGQSENQNILIRNFYSKLKELQ